VWIYDVMLGADGEGKDQMHKTFSRSFQHKMNGDVEGLGFDSHGNLAAVSTEGELAKVEPNHEIQKVKIDSFSPGGLAYEPNGLRLAIGSRSSPDVKVVDAQTLQTLKDLPPEATWGSTAALPRVTWSPKGDLYVAGSIRGTALNGEPAQTMVEKVATIGSSAFEKPVPCVAGADVITALAPLPDGGVCYAAADGWGVTDLGSKSRHSGLGIHDLRGPGAGNALQIDERATTVRFPISASENAATLSYSAIDRVLEDGGSTPLEQPIQGSDRFSIQRLSNTSISVSGKAQEGVRCFAVDPKDRYVLVGCVSDTKGKEILKVLPDGTTGQSWSVPGEVWGLNLTSDGEIAVAALGDGTVRWYRTHDGTLVVSLYPSINKEDWIAWTPSGEFDCSVRGEDFVEWDVNDGADGPADYYPGSKFHSKYYRPELVSSVLQERTELETGGVVEPPQVYELGPVFRLVDIKPGKDQISFKVAAHAHSNMFMGDVQVRVFLDGYREPVQMFSNLGIGLEDRIIVHEFTYQVSEMPHSMVVRFDTGKVQSADVTWNRGESSVLSRSNYAGLDTSDTGTLNKGALWIIAVGAGSFQRQGEQGVPRDLANAKYDAEEFVQRMRKETSLYTELKGPGAIVGKNANRSEILDAFKKLSSMGRYDKAMIFIAAHGEASRGKYGFVPFDYKPQDFSSTVQLDELLKSIPENTPHGPVFLFLDTCYAGGLADSAGNLHKVDRTGQVLGANQPDLAILSACQANESAFDPPDPTMKHGIFTHFLLQGLNGKAANSKGEIGWIRLAAHVSEEVTDYVRKKLGVRQRPGILSPHSMPDVVVATSDPQTARLSRSRSLARTIHRSHASTLGATVSTY
jgi:WD40 repeat protein